MSVERVPISFRELRENLDHSTEECRGECVAPFPRATVLALVEAVQALTDVVLIEDVYRDLGVEDRAGLLPVFESQHRQVMNAARTRLAVFSFGDGDESA